MHTSRLVPHTPLESCPAGTSIIGLDATGYWHPCLNIPADHTAKTDALKVSIVDALSFFKRSLEHPSCAKNCPDGNDCYGGCPADKINGIDRVCANRQMPKAIKLEVR